VSEPLLAVDGDSFAHRAYHGLPASIRRADGRPANALVGFMTMLVRLWQDERPRAVAVGWDTLDVPTYRHVLLPSYQSGRVFEEELVEQLGMLPRLVASTGIVCGRAAGFEADDFLGAAAAQEAARGGSTLVATSDRDAFQLVSSTVTVLQPVRGATELRRIGPSEVRELYGVTPLQVPDFIALRGDPSDRIPGARGVGAKRAAAILADHGSLEAAFAAGLFAAEAEALRSFRRIATFDLAAPLPELADLRPDWAAGAVAARELGLVGLARRLDEAAG
jgi:DNA polymerase I